MSEMAVQITYTCDHQTIVRSYLITDDTYTEAPPICIKCYGQMSKVGSAVIISSGHLDRDLVFPDCKMIAKGVWQQRIG